VTRQQWREVDIAATCIGLLFVAITCLVLGIVHFGSGAFWPLFVVAFFTSRAVGQILRGDS
jgi:hypothetical protein